jgi:hypothetical protein
MASLKINFLSLWDNPCRGRPMRLSGTPKQLAAKRFIHPPYAFAGWPGATRRDEQR